MIKIKARVYDYPSNKTPVRVVYTLSGVKYDGVYESIPAAQKALSARYNGRINFEFTKH